MVRVRLLALPLAVLCVSSGAAAQGGRDSVSRAVIDSGRPSVVSRPAAPPATIADSLLAPVSPGRAFLTSLLLPGLGQSRLRRPMAGAIYAAVEALSVVMLLKSQNDLRIARLRVDDAIVAHYRVDPLTGAPVLDGDGAFQPLDSLENAFGTGRVSARRAQVEDWIAVLVANHLFAGADAFVASLLWDLPARVGLRFLSRGVGLGLTVPW